MIHVHDHRMIVTVKEKHQNRVVTLTSVFKHSDTATLPELLKQLGKYLTI